MVAISSTGAGEADGCLRCATRFLGFLDKCTCEAAAATKKLQTPSLPAQLSLTSSPSPLPSSPVAPAPGSATVDSKGHPTPALRTRPSSPADKPRDLRREREEETAEGESTPKRRRITPTPAPTSSPVPPATAAAPWSAPVPPGAVPSPEVAEPPPKAAKVIVPDKAPESHPQDAQQSAATPDSTLPLVIPQPVAAPEQSGDPNAAAPDVAAVPRKIGIQHIQLVYETVGQTLQCRMCLCVVSLSSVIPSSVANPSV